MRKLKKQFIEVKNVGALEKLHVNLPRYRRHGDEREAQIGRGGV